MNSKDLELIKDTVRVIPDFPKEGIMFQDLTPVFGSPKCTDLILDDMYDRFSHCGITKVLGVEARGFILGGAFAHKIDAGFVPVRKQGKLPGKVIGAAYQKEYGEDTLEIPEGSLDSEDVVLIHDDILATGGTIAAVIALCRKCGVRKIYVNCIMELTDLGGSAKLSEKVVEVYCPLQVEEYDGKLKAEDIQVGDIILDKYGQTYVAKGVYDDNQVAIEKHLSINLDQLVKIKLTDEMVKDLGFNKPMNTRGFYHQSVKGLAIQRNSDGGFTLQYLNRKTNRSCLVDVRYLHELQHMLRIIGIEDTFCKSLIK